MSHSTYLRFAGVALTGGNSNLIEDAMELLDNVVDLASQVARVNSHS